MGSPTLLFILFLTSLSTFAQNLSLDEVLAESLQVRGGERAMKSIRSLSFEGTRTGDGHKGHAAKFIMRGEYFLVGCTQPQCSVAEGYDEKGAWEMSPRRKRVMRVSDSAANALRRAAQIDEPYFDYAARGNKVRLAGKTQFNGREAYEIIVGFPWGLLETHYIDSNTFLPLGNHKAVQVHARGNNVDGITYYEDFRPVNGFLLPFRSRWVRTDDGTQLELVQWTEIKANAIPGPSFFHPPKVHPSPATALSVRMYEASARASTRELLSMYRRFRYANPTVDTAEDLNWLGYELLKKERLDSAIAILKIVTEEHPDSSNAFDSLGDGYEQMGRRDDAIQAYKKAIALDPKANFTREKLVRLESQASK